MTERDPFRRALEHFNSGEFFEAHEAWEELWLRETEPEKTFLQGLIQVAAAFHHWSKGNRKGARSLLAGGLAKLERFPRVHRGLALADFRAEAREWAKALENDSPVRRELPRIRLADAGAKKKRGE